MWKAECAVDVDLHVDNKRTLLEQADWVNEPNIQTLLLPFYLNRGVDITCYFV